MLRLLLSERCVLRAHALVHRYVKWSLDSAQWKAASTTTASVTVDGLLDGVHALSLKHDYSADGRSETESVDYT